MNCWRSVARVCVCMIQRQSDAAMTSYVAAILDLDLFAGDISRVHAAHVSASSTAVAAAAAADTGLDTHQHHQPSPADASATAADL